LHAELVDPASRVSPDADVEIVRTCRYVESRVAAVVGRRWDHDLGWGYGGDVDDDAIRSLATRLGRAYPSGGTVIERAAILAEGPTSTRS
jgi:hypothetical protein